MSELKIYNKDLRQNSDNVHLRLKRSGEAGDRIYLDAVDCETGETLDHILAIRPDGSLRLCRGVHTDGIQTDEKGKIVVSNPTA